MSVRTKQLDIRRTNERRDKSHASLGTSNSLTETEKKSQVAVNLVVAFENAGSLDTFPGRSNLDQDAVLVNSAVFV